MNMLYTYIYALRMGACMYVCMHVRLHTFICVSASYIHHMSFCLCININKYIYTCIYVYVRMYVRMYVYMHTCKMDICIWSCYASALFA